MDLASLRINAAAVEQGAWVGDIPGLGDIRFRVRGFSNSDFKRRRSELVTALPLHLRNDPKETERITTRLIVETILLDWSGLTEKGVPLPYSSAKAAELLSEPDYAPLADGIAWAAASVASITESAAAADTGN